MSIQCWTLLTTELEKSFRKEHESYSVISKFWYPAKLKCLDLNWRAWETFWQERLHAFPVLAILDSNPRLSLFSGTPEKAQGKKSATPGPRTRFFFAVVWIKWMNIFRPAYFTPRHWGVGGDIAVWAKSRVERKHLDEAGERLRQEEIEGIQLCSCLSEYQSRQMRRSYKYADIKYAPMVNAHICQVRKTFCA